MSDKQQTMGRRDSEHVERLVRAKIALSVYNALSLTGQDMSVANVVGFLHAHWPQTQSRAAALVDSSTVLDAAKRLQKRGYLAVKGDQLSILVRDPRSHRGRPLAVDHASGAIVDARSLGIG